MKQAILETSWKKKNRSHTFSVSLCMHSSSLPPHFHHLYVLLIFPYFFSFKILEITHLVSEANELKEGRFQVPKFSKRQKQACYPMVILCFLDDFGKIKRWFCCWISASIHWCWIEMQRQSFGWRRKKIAFIALPDKGGHRRLKP